MSTLIITNIEPEDFSKKSGKTSFTDGERTLAEVCLKIVLHSTQKQRLSDQEVSELPQEIVAEWPKVLNEVRNSSKKSMTIPTLCRTLFEHGECLGTAADHPCTNKDGKRVHRDYSSVTHLFRHACKSLSILEAQRDEWFKASYNGRWQKPI